MPDYIIDHAVQYKHYVLQLQLRQTPTSRMAEDKNSTSDDDIQGAASVQEEKGGFRFNARRVLLTYSQCAGRIGSKHDLIAALKEHLVTHGGLIRVAQYVVGRELHADGGEHFHCYVSFTEKYSTRNPRAFDLHGVHPNIRVVKHPQRAIAYCMKDGDFIDDKLDSVLWPTWNNFRKNQADFTAWVTARRSRNRLPPPLFVTLPTGDRFDLQFDPAIRRRHLCIVGGYDAGKSFWAQTTFANTAVHAISKDGYPYEGYNDQSIILYDDIYPTYQELVSCANSYQIPTPVYGKVRYTKVYWPLGQARIIIILHNEPPDYGDRQRGFDTRFTTIRIPDVQPPRLLLRPVEGQLVP